MLKAIKNILKSILHPRQAGKEAAIEYIGLHNRVKTKEEIENDFKKYFKKI